MIETRNGARLALEAREAIGARRDGLRQHLDRDFASETRVARAIDLAHAPGSERAGDLVGAELCSLGEGHSRVV
jgi:hypothetical protein